MIEAQNTISTFESQIRSFSVATFNFRAIIPSKTSDKSPTKAKITISIFRFETSVNTKPPIKNAMNKRKYTNKKGILVI